MYLIFSEVNRYFEGINKSKYLIWFVTKTSVDYNEKYNKISFNLDDPLHLNKRIEVPKMTMVVRAIFHDNNKYYPQIFFGEFLYKL